MVEMIHTLRHEHADMEKLLHVFEEQLNTYKRRGRVNREIIRDILDYCRGYPTLCHHPKEDLIFQKLRAVAHVDVLNNVGDLIAEHEELKEVTDELEAAIDNLLTDTTKPSREKFAHVAKKFLDFYRHHMEKEEEVFFPAALKILSKEDWADIDRKASEQKGPPFGHDFEAKFDELRREIL